MISLKLDNTLIPKIASETAILEATKRPAKILCRRTVTIKVGVTGLQLAGNRQRSVTILCPYRRT